VKFPRQPIPWHGPAADLVDEPARARPSAIGVRLLAHLAVFVLVAASAIEALKTIVDVGERMASRHEAIVIGNLAVALLPAGAVLFWGAKTTAAQFFRLAGPRHRPASAGRRPGKDVAGFWMVAAFLTAVALATATLADTGMNIGSALQATGRLSFLLFWPAYAGGALATLFGSRFAPLARRGREFGLAYAAAQVVHFALVVWTIQISHQPLVARLMPFFAFGVLWTGGLAFSSFERSCDIFDAEFWRLLRNLGLEYITLIFFADFVLDPIEKGVENSLFYLPFSVLTIVGPILRIAAAARPRLPARRPAARG
jgi:hypothetical protein